MKRKLLSILVIGILLAISQLMIAPGASAHQMGVDSGTWSLTGSMSIARAGAASALLHTGKVLVAGGQDANFNALTSAELYDPRTGTWSLTGSMATGHRNPTATLLHDGRVLVIGGYNSQGYWITAADLYDPHIGTWSSAGNVSASIESATLLHNGNVLVTTDDFSGNSNPITAELYHPRTNTWSPISNIPLILTYVDIATLLDNGDVLVTSGNNVELYHPRTNTWSPTSSIPPVVYSPGTNYLASSATLLRNGKVLFIFSGKYSSTVDLYDPETGTWSRTGDMSTPQRSGTTTLLPDGNVLLAGGDSETDHSFSIPFTEVYNVHTGTWSPTADMLIPLADHTAILLPNGKVLITGGYTVNSLLGERNVPTNEAELYTPAHRHRRD